MNLDLLKRNKESIIIGLLTSFIFFFFEKVIDWLISKFILTLTFFSKSFEKYYYTKISEGISGISTLDFGYTIMYIVLFILLIFVITFIQYYESLDAYIVSLVNNIDNTESNEDKIKQYYKFKDKIKAKSNFYTTNFDLILNRKRRFGFFLVTYTVFGFFIFINTGFNTIIDINVRKSNSSFLLRTAMLKPYISENQEKILISNWARIRNKKDFDKMNIVLDSLLIKNKLPN